MLWIQMYEWPLGSSLVNGEDGWQQRINIWRMLLTGALCGAVWTWVAAEGDQKARLRSWKWHFFSFENHTRPQMVRLKVFLTWPATVMLLSLSLPVICSLRYAAIRTFCLINNLSVMYWTLALIWFLCEMCGEEAASLRPSTKSHMLVFDRASTGAGTRMKEQSLRVCNYI